MRQNKLLTTESRLILLNQARIDADCVIEKIRHAKVGTGADLNVDYEGDLAQISELLVTTITHLENYFRSKK